MTVSNIIGPLMVFLDRFLIGAFISMAAVAYYATPFDVVSKLWLVPNALVGVLFPAMSASFIKDQTRTAELFLRGVKYIFVILFPISLLIVTLAPEGLQFWLGTEFSQHSFRVLQLIALGVLINSVAFVPGSLLQGAGRPDLTGKLHLAELPLYLLVVCYFIKKFGIEGAALAWVLRVTLDAIVLFFLAYRLLISNKVFTLRQSAITIGVALIPLTLALFLTGPLLMKCLFLVFTLMTFLFFAWFVILTPKECLQLARSFKTLPGTWSGHNFDESRK
jgi:O-antigen/teichoic acid export membrane protein